MLNTQNLIGALSQVGVPITRMEAEEVIAHYTDEGDGSSVRTVHGRERGKRG